MPRGVKKVVPPAVPSVGGTGGAVAKEQPNTQLVEILSDLASSVAENKGRLEKLEQPPVITVTSQTMPIGAVQPGTVMSFGDPQGDPQGAAFGGIRPLSTAELLRQVPYDMKAAAENVLGSKFKFECDPQVDQPTFLFTIIVPPEYSNLKGVEDRRSKMISNALGLNGVEEWCKLVKMNVIKFLGQNINTSTL